MNILDDSKDSSFSNPLCKVIVSELLTVLRMYDVQDESTDSMEGAEFFFLKFWLKFSAYITIGTILLNSYNPELSSYEPFFEPWGIQFKLTQSARKLGVHLVSLSLYFQIFE